jgi:hypothetical protein
LVRDSSVSGGFVISYAFGGRTFHAQVMPERAEDPTDGTPFVYYSLDEGKTKFFDLLQMVEFYQINRGSLHTKLTHYIVRSEQQQRSANWTASSSSSTDGCSAASKAADAQRSESPVSR